MIKNQNWLKLIAVTFAVAPFVAANADDLLGGKRGGGGGSGSGSGSGTRGGGNSGGGGKKQEEPPKKSDDRGRDGGSRSTGGSSSGGSGTTSSGGRVVQDRGNGGDGQLNNRRSQGRSGTSQYGTNSNGATRSNGARIVVDDQVPNYSDARRQANREENVRVVNNSRHQYRSGYYHYNQNWCDDDFTYPFYSFTYNNNCALSPWYSYSHLPAYVSYRRVSFDDCFELRIGLDFGYRWEYRRSYDRYSNTYDLDRAVANIDQAFDQSDTRRIGSMIPRRDRVTIRTRWERPYTLNSDDFYDMMEDLIENTRTRNYHIRNVRHDRGWGTVQVTAEHVYQDGWRKTRTNWHTYTLQDTGRGYQIIEFSVSDRGF
jgi:hypothetical protein